MSEMNPTTTVHPASLGELKITAHPTSDPQVCIFSLTEPVSEETFNCSDKSKAEGAPLLEALFALPGVSQVMISVTSITVAKTGTDSWQILGKQVGQAIRQAFSEARAQGASLIPASYREKLKGPVLQAGDLRGQVQQVLDAEVNPSVASHGGHIKLEDIRGTRLYVTMSGGCKGCSSAAVTLKQGVERIIFSKFPQLTEIVDVTDHSTGTQPYYS
ncbi:MAG: NifU family protein [Methylotenera sp.]|nr:NifU family protein [Oligoflexia bacterium]